MTRKATIAAALTLCLLPAGAQELTNHALGRPYRVTPAPADRYADDSGPQAHVPGEFYRGELTDGVSGPQDSYKAAQWVGWRDTDYREPISVEVDLEEEVRVDRVEATVCGSPGSIQPPERIDLALLGEGFPWPVFVHVAQIQADAPWDPETTRVYTYAADIGGLPARRVRLDFQEQTWKYLFVDEIRILGLDQPAGGMLPVQDVTLQAEAGHTDCESVQVEGASGRAVLLHEPGERVRFEMPLPAGDYTVRVRSLAVEPDTFSEIALTLGQQAMRPQAITNTVFTWQRSHFTQPRDGPATVTMTLREGAGVYLDQVRIHRLTLNETITRLHDFRRDTILASGGEPRCLISVGDEGQYRAQGEAVAAAIEDRCGARPKILEGDQIAEEHFRTTSVIELGTAESTFAILRSSPNAWSRIPGPPEDGEPQIYVDVEPRGTGVNTIVLGGVDEAQVRRSVRAFIERLEGGETLSYPWGLLPVPAYEDDREHYRQMAVESGKWLRQGAIRHLHRDWKYYPDDTFVLLGYRYLEYLDSYDTIRQIASDGFIDAETQKIVGNWDRREHHQSFAGDQGRLHRLQLTNLILLMARKCEGIFDWNCCQVPGEAKSHHPPEEMTQILQQRPEMIAHNHQTFPTYAIATAGDYFAKYYDLAEARRWVDWAEMFMRGPLQSSKPMEDCWGYMDITYTHVARYAAITGRWDWFDQPMLYDFLTLRLMSHDNMGSGVGYGDVGAYRPGDGPVTPEDNAGNWLSASGGRLDLSRARWDGVTGLYVHPLEPMYYDYYGEDSPVPLEECFDKLSFRDEVEPRAPYLLLDGVSGGYHGHWDGNSILRFTANTRMWLCEGDYLKSDPKDHNTLTIMRNAESGTPGLFSSLQARFEAGPWASTITRTPDYTGLDWDRHLIYSRRGETFLLFDEVTAVEPGTYDVKARFRSLGETSLAESTWHVQQQGEHFFLHAPSPGRLMEATDPEDTSTWESYQFADDTTPKLLSHGVRGELQPGERMVLPAVFYATSQDAPRQSVRRVADGAIVIDGDLRAVAGVGGLSLEHMHSDARQFVAGEAGMLLVEGTRLSAAEETLMLADAPVRLSVDVEAGTAVIEADRPARLRLLGVARPIELDAGRHELHGDFGPLAAALAEAWRLTWDRAQAEIARPETAPTRNMTPAFEVELPAEVTVLESGDLTGDGALEFVAGCDDGTLVALDPEGNELWRHDLGARINDIAVGQIDVGGAPEIAVGVEDSHLHVLAATGDELWSRFFEAHYAEGGQEGHVRAVLIADFDADGVPEVAVGCANTFFYVLDNTGEPRGPAEEPWETNWRHKAVAIGAADLTGDALLELLCGYTYFSQRIIDFSRSGRGRLSVVPSAKGGTSVISASDVDGDDLPEALYGDVDGRVTACSVASGDDNAADVVWTKHIGDDRVSALVPADLDGDGSPEIALASHSGFLALLSAGGEVRWVRYADNQVTDAALIEGAIARSSRDGSVAVFDPAGAELARWQVGEPLQMLAVDASGDRPLIVAAGGSTVRGAAWER